MSALLIANTQIRQDAIGRYCLNDLHQASGGAKRHQPADWLRLKQTQELVAEITRDDGLTPGIPGVNPVEATEGRYGGGTYAVKELVYAYAMWISAAFHLHVIRAYDALVLGNNAPTPPLAAQPQHLADQFVGAGRIFAATYRAARIARLPYERALQAATECAHRHTGIDWRAECGFEFPEPAPLLEDPLREQVTAALATCDQFQMDQLIAEHSLGRCQDAGLMRRIGGIARSLGWRPNRRQLANRQFITVWRRQADRMRDTSPET